MARGEGAPMQRGKGDLSASNAWLDDAWRHGEVVVEREGDLQVIASGKKAPGHLHAYPRGLARLACILLPLAIIQTIHPRGSLGPVGAETGERIERARPGGVAIPIRVAFVAIRSR